MRHAEFEALISDALDGVLAGDSLRRFDEHRAACESCALMFQEAEAGMNWLSSLEEVAPPANLVHNIMAATVGEAASAAAERAERGGWLAKLRAFAAPALQPMLQPRFALSFAMAFFSISAALSLGGVSLRNFTAASLAPSSLMNNTVRSFRETTARAERYYDNLRFVYELESRYRELKNALPDSNDQPQEQQQQKNQNPDRKNKSSGEPRFKQGAPVFARFSLGREQYNLDLPQAVVASNEVSSFEFQVSSCSDCRSDALELGTRNAKLETGLGRIG